MFVTINCKWCRSISTRSKDNFTTKTNKQISNTLVCFICKYTLSTTTFPKYLLVDGISYNLSFHTLDNVWEHGGNIQVNVA